MTKLMTKCRYFPKRYCISTHCGWNEDTNGESFGCARMNGVTANVIIVLCVVFVLAMIAFFAPG